MTDVAGWIEHYYDRESESEWERLERHRTEWAVTLRAMRDYLPPPPAQVLDCGGGPGRYAIELARQGYEVTLFDLSAGNLRLAWDATPATTLFLRINNLADRDVADRATFAAGTYRYLPGRGREWFVELHYNPGLGGDR